jgi:EAL domain-containing protein (putative c-di-GMP-specific phosphodiesterase class I)
VLRAACRQTQEWRSTGLVNDNFYVSVNLSAHQLQEPDLVDDVSRALNDSGLPTRALVLEVTESALIENLNLVLPRLHALRRLGVRLAFDDFGTGYSSLTHLRLLLFNRIKIDKSFIAEMTTRTDCVAIVSAVIALGYSLGVSITAEGVETAEQLLMLRAAGCTEVQGYLFSRPKPASEILANLSAGMLEVVAA